VADELLCRRALQARKDNRSMVHCEGQSQNARKEPMVDIILLLMVIASAISLLVVSPRGLQKKAILALREYEDIEPSRAHGGDEDGLAKAIPINLGRSGSDPSADWPI
jgi:hypothetical protein